MRILWVKIGGLWPPNAGGRLRSFHIVRELARHHELTVLTTHSSSEEASGQPAGLGSCIEVVSLSHRAPKRQTARFLLTIARSWFSGKPIDALRHSVPALHREVAEHLRTGNYDLCIADFIFAMPNIPVNAEVPVIYFAHNIEYMIWKRLAMQTHSPPHRAALEFEWRKVRRYEKSACRRSGWTIAVSEVDRSELERLSPGANVGVVPTGVDVEYFAPRDLEEMPCELVYVGSMDWYPNEDGVAWFISDVLPLIRNMLPAVTMTIVGRNPTPRLRRIAAEAGVKVTGTVPDVREYLARAMVCIVPLRIGGGTRLKIFETLAMGKATVSTTVGAEGLPVTPRRNILIADTAKGFAASVQELLCNAALRRDLGAEGRRLVVEQYTWGEAARRFAELCDLAIARGGRQVSERAERNVEQFGTSA